ncbi:MAG: hypothetical protein IKD58_03810 [Loktanella sp.]|nr:hypothetical protein [Loktanella sp.]
MFPDRGAPAPHHAVTPRLRMNGAELDTARLSPEGQRLVGLIQFAQQRQQDLASELALLETARQVYVATLKAEIVKARSGVDLDNLFGNDH